MVTNIIQLQKYKNLFKDDYAFECFIKEFESALGSGMKGLFVDTKFIGSTFSADLTKGFFTERIKTLIDTNSIYFDKIVQVLIDLCGESNEKIN